MAQPKFSQGSVYWFDPEPSKGSEFQKIRPCVVVSPDAMNENLRTVIVVPLTTTIHPWPFRQTVTVLGEKASAACDQVRSVDKQRLKARIHNLQPNDQQKLFSILQAIFSERQSPL